jgi:hypothetical protein
MKTRIVVFVIAAIFAFEMQSFLHAQSTPMNQTMNDARVNVWSTSNSSGLLPSNATLTVGDYDQNYDQARAYFQWSIPDNLIPDGATITQVKLDFNYSIGSGPQYPGFIFVNITDDITTASAQTLYNDVTNASSENYFTGTVPGSYSYETTDPYLATWLSSSLSNNRFAVAIMSPGEGGHPEYNYQVYTSSVKLTVTVAPQTVTVDQVFGDGSRVETEGTKSQIGHYETNAFANYDVPKQFSFNINANETIRGDQSPWLNMNTGGLEKYWMWNSDNNVVNPKTFSIQPGTTSLTSHFRSTYNATLQDQLLDGGSPGGSVNFKDPWLIDATDPAHANSPINQGMNAPFKSVVYSANNIGTSTSYKGVFLSQEPALTPTYYSISAPTSPSINGFTGIFQNWSASGAHFQNSSAAQTAIVFDNGSATVTANYKAHLASFSSTATANNNQRKIAQAANGTYFMVYSSIDRIWMTKSTDGVNWGNEMEVSTGTPYDICKSPSIFADENSNMVAVVWQGIDGGGDYSNIYFRLYNNSTGTWDNREELPTFYPSLSGYEASPVISGYGLDGNGNNAIVVWREPDGLAVTAKNNGAWTSVECIPNTNDNSLWPSITRIISGVYGVCWEQDDPNTGDQRINYVEICYGGCGYNMEFLDAAQVSPYGWSMNQRPTIAVNGSRTVVVSWQSFDNVWEGLSVHVREMPLGGSWSSTITSFSSSSINGAKPVIGTFLDRSSYYVMWEVDGSIYSTRGLGTTWATPNIIASGSSGGAALSAINRTRDGYGLLQLWKKSDGQYCCNKFRSPKNRQCREIGSLPLKQTHHHLS